MLRLLGEEALACDRLNAQVPLRWLSGLKFNLVVFYKHLPGFTGGATGGAFSSFYIKFWLVFADGLVAASKAATAGCAGVALVLGLGI